MSIIYFSSIIIIALFFSFSKSTFGEINILSESLANIVGLALLVVNLLISITSLIHLGDSWRAGVIEYQKTKLITSGIYKYTRNPYFLSYLLMFFAYTVLLQNLILLGLSLVAIFFVHKMILREEEYLEKNHKNEFLQYKAKVPRYIMVPVCIQDKISGQYPEGGK